ncbi:DUF2235 domain-containing protein [Chryseobacterium oryctis]|uniref:DUF2235 domain-containing protein n=1 Tax=Chryseobacterium oryctis TaxID=2952618 RepID=A0ABT3HRT8_9FLAO|nr:DUF2235 domain-containing protein [Chryseobacterium oryctis]MCW3162492.1 DUF2235 domain-containing protein [Chryseobacterium oryctis]
MGTSNKFGNYSSGEEGKQPEGSVNIYVGMFFDGTGNNRFNSDTIYYTELAKQGGKIKAESIPAKASYTKVNKDVDKEENVKVEYTDRDSYWNPYSNVAKLFDLYKEIKDMDSKEEMGGDYYILKQYVEGIGTKRDKADDMEGSGLARGSWGVISRVEEGIKNLVKDQFKNISKDKKINKIVFDVFGFSRGATAARHFCNEVSGKAKYRHKRIKDPYESKAIILSPELEVTKHAGGLLGTELKNAGYKPTAESFTIEIRFLGLFDTVISDMIVKENMGYKAGFGGVLLPILSFAPLAQEALQDIKTNLSGIRIGKVFHIKAQTEWRKNFPFTPSEQGYTLGMLGAHSDIGGGYAELDKYEPVLSFFDVKTGDQKTLADMEKYKQFYISSWVCKSFDNNTNTGIQFTNTYDHVTETTIKPQSMGVGIYNRDIKAPNDFPDEGKTISKDPYYQVYQTKESDHYVLQDCRYISNKYALIPMYLMLEKAIENKVPFYSKASDSPFVKKNMLFEYELPNDEILQKYFELMKNVSKEENRDKDGSYSMPTEMYSHICNKYVHLSAHFGGFKNDFLTVKTGDHNLLESMLFLNQPVEPTIKDDKVSYQREIYHSPH